MAFWLRNIAGVAFTIDDLGVTLPIAGEIDINASILYENILKSTDLPTAITGGDVELLDGPGGTAVAFEVPDLNKVKSTQEFTTGSGVLSGSVLTLTGGIGFSVAAGSAVVKDATTGLIYLVEWAAPLTHDTVWAGDNFIGVDKTGALSITSSFPTADVAKIGYIYTNATNSAILGYSSTPNVVAEFAHVVHEFARLGVGALLETGCIVTEQIGVPLHLNVNQGAFFIQLNRFTTGDKTTFTKMHKTSDDGWVEVVVNPNIVDTAQWNDTTKPNGTALVAMSPGFWKKDLVLQMPTGDVYYVYGQAEYASESAALEGTLPEIPQSILQSGCVLLAHITLQQGDATVASRIYDIRPNLSRIFGYGTAGGSGVAILHSSLLGLTSDDHGQYHNDSRALTWLHTRSTTDVAEGTNKYFLDARVDANGHVTTAYNHTALTNNPHSVTKTQVNLGSVTNDAQLKRAAADFDSFTVKGTPAAADIILLEDSADTLNKKKATLGTLPTNAHATTHKPSGSDTLDWRQLTYFIDEGPAEGFVSGSYKELTGGAFPTAVIWYDSAGPAKKKIVEKLITRDAHQIPTAIVWKIYDAAEVLVKTITDTPTYTGAVEISRTRTIA